MTMIRSHQIPVSLTHQVDSSISKTETETLTVFLEEHEVPVEGGRFVTGYCVGIKGVDGQGYCDFEEAASEYEALCRRLA